MHGGVNVLGIGYSFLSSFQRQRKRLMSPILWIEKQPMMEY
jgi:hypothetical protein